MTKYIAAIDQGTTIGLSFLTMRETLLVLTYNELRVNWGKEKEWHPAMDAEVRKKLYSGWKNA